MTRPPPRRADDEVQRGNAPVGDTDVLRAEEDAVLGAFAHDVRSIGAAAEGLAFRAASRSDDPRVKAYLEAIRESMCRLSSMAASALELARAGDLARSAQQTSRTGGETVDVAAVARTVAITMEEAFQEAGASCVLALGTGSVVGDRTAIYRIVLNLLTNALAHGTHQAGSRVVLSVETTEGYVQLRVADEGPGFPRALLGAMPGPSWQAGRGLGLAIVTRLAVQHGGRLAVENGAARGAVVSVYLRAMP